MAVPIIPVAKALYLCDYHFAFENNKNKVDLYGIFNAIQPTVYPYKPPRSFVAFAQLVGGLREVPFFFDIVYAPRLELVRETDAQIVHFPHRRIVVNFVYEFTNVEFEEPGLYLIELWCQNNNEIVCIADVPLLLRPTIPKDQPHGGFSTPS